MKVSREQAARNRERILDTAAQLFRERGFEGIGVADTMKAAGLTHGAFYGHFSSKEDLIAQACGRAFSRSHERWSKMAGRAPDDPLSSIVRSYLTRRHRDDPGTGCALAALGPDMARHGSGVRRAVADGLRSAFDLLSGLAPGKSEAAKRQNAISTYASLVGAMIMARAVDDPALSQEILDAVRASVSGSGAPTRSGASRQYARAPTKSG
jgi:TetR/AcrR family transcriptional repressor of nem operon